MARQFTKKVAVSLLGTFSALAFAGTAQADCNGTVCHSGTSHVGAHSAYTPPALSTWSSAHSHTGSLSSPTYAKAPSYGSGSSSYSSGVSSFGSSSYSSTAPCPSGSTKQADGTCLSTSSSFSSGTSYGSGGGSYSSGSYGSGSSYNSGAVSQSDASARYGSGSISSTYTDYSVAPLTRTTLSGLGVNESLQATNCPVSVHNPSGAKVLGCYNVVKPKPVVRTVVRTVPTVYQVVRPIVYVRYPVPVCNTCCTPETVYSRYGSPTFSGGNNFGGGSCGW